jgi:3-hydroxybutyryl-CoA dehydrogenase
MASTFQRIGILGAGAMGRGIAQLAAQAGKEVWLYDQQDAQARDGQNAIIAQWQKQVTQGKQSSTDAAALCSRLNVAKDLSDFHACDLIVEAVIENLRIKRDLMSQLVNICPQAVLTTNTSSLSITTIAAGHPYESRVAGLHFFNPAPLMKVVEVIPGLNTDRHIIEVLCDFVRELGHTAVIAQDTPGFIVNHAGRAYGTEALKIIGESVADHEVIDRILKEQAGFKLGPFELMDLTGLDVSQPVMESIYRQYYEEPRYRPSVITAQRLSAGVLGKKSGRGFYNYLNNVAQRSPEPTPPIIDAMVPVWVSPKAARRPELYRLLKELGANIETAVAPSESALILVAPLGLDVTTIAAVERLDPTRTIGIDMLLDDLSTQRRVLATTPATRADMRDAAWALFSRDGKPVSVIRDSGGFVTQRILAHIVNIASDMCQQGICSPVDLDTAVTLGLGYPMGPLALGDRLGPGNVLEVLFNMQTVYGDSRYRPSPWLRRRGALGLSLKQEEI